MKKFLIYAFSTIFFSLFNVLIIAILIISFPKDTFIDTYQSVIRDKFHTLIDTKEPKIIMIAGSSSAFGLNQDLLEKMTGYKIVNLGLHAGFGIDFETELSKANIQENDIVLLGYEYLWFKDSAYQEFSPDLVLSGIDTEFSMYKYIPKKKIPQLIGYIFPFAYKKNSYTSTPESVYSHYAFDSETGQMTWLRDKALADYSENIKYYKSIDIKDENGKISIGEKSIEYLSQFKKYVESKGANIYFVSSPILYDSITCTPEDFLELKKLEEEKIGIPYISDPRLYMFPCDLMYNSINHTNSEGEKYRTAILAEDLIRYGVVNKTDNSNTLAREIGEPITLTDNLPKRLLHDPVLIHKVYKVENGKITIYVEGKDYLFDDDYGTIMRTDNSSIPNYKNHQVQYQSGKYTITEENPENNRSYQILIDYDYYADWNELLPIKNDSFFLSEKLKEKIIQKEKIKVILCGDFIGTGVDINKNNSFLGYLSETLVSYYGIEIETDILAADNATHNNLLGNIDLVLGASPDLVLIEYGFNDHLFTSPSVEENLIKFKDDIQKLVSIFLDNSIDVVLIGFFQQNMTCLRENVDITISYNEALRNIAQNNNIYFADVYETFYKVGMRKHIYEDIMVDYTFHPNEWGHKLYLTSIMDLFNIYGNMTPLDIDTYIYVGNN